MAIHLPKTPTDSALFAMFWLGGVFTLVYECYFILWHYHTEWSTTVVCLYTVALYLAFIIYSCMLKIISTDVSLSSLKVKDANIEEASADWRFCEICKTRAPPRSHHCKICDTCILKRDHHCWFAGYCIGHQNHRFFLCLVLHASLAGVWANVYNWQYVMDVKGGFTWTTLPSLLAPHVGLVFGQYSIHELIITFITSAGALFTLFFLALLANQLIQLYHGQVQYERKKNIQDYSLGLHESISEVFGTSGLWGLLCPFVSTTLPSDGCSFPQRDSKVK